MVPSPVSNTGASQRLTSRQQGGYQYVSPPSRPPPARSSLDESVHDSERCCLWNCGQYPLVMVTYRKPSSFPPSTAHPSLLSLSEAIMSLVQRHHLQASLVVRDIKSAGRRAWEDPQNRPRWRCSSVVELLTGRSRTRNSFFLTVSTAILRPFPEHLLHPVWLSAGFSDLVLGYWILKHIG